MSTGTQNAGEISSDTESSMKAASLSQETYHFLQIFPSEVNKIYYEKNN